VLWDQSSRGDSNLFKYEHLHLKEELKGKIEKVEAVFRVGFLAVMVNKNAAEKGKFWQKESVECVHQDGESEEEQLNLFQKYFEEKRTEDDERQ
jgi:recombinational DNA repair protein RecT